MDELVTIPVGGAAVNKTLGFRAMSVVVNNPTNQWAMVDALGTPVPQYTLGATYFLGGTSKAQVSLVAPPGQVQPPTISGQAATFFFTDQVLAPSAGVGMLGGRAPYYDRNPKDVNKNASTTSNSGDGPVALWTYTIPAGRRAYLEVAYLFTQIITLFANDSAYLDTHLRLTISGGAETGIVGASFFSGKRVGTTAVTAVGMSMEFQPGDLITAYSINNRAAGAGVCAHQAWAKFTEFDV